MIGGPLNTHRVAQVRPELRSGPRSQIAGVPGSRAVRNCGPERMPRAVPAGKNSAVPGRYWG
eukprot:12215206-Alexandrium_andersonii.AAC.1